MMMPRQRLLRIISVLLLITACATTPEFDINDVNLGVTPQQATAEISALKGTKLLWGGVIIASGNYKETTQFEILAYPLDENQRPELDKAPLGRFIALKEGYLESRDYSQGRLITVRGALLENRKGKIGESEYIYPVIGIENQFLWPLRSDSSEPQFHFGIGVMLHN